MRGVAGPNAKATAYTIELIQFLECTNKQFNRIKNIEVTLIY